MWAVEGCRVGNESSRQEARWENIMRGPSITISPAASEVLAKTIERAAHQ